MGLLRFFKTLFERASKPKPFIELGGRDDVDTMFQNIVVENRVPGISVSIFKDGKNLLQKGYGYADLEKEIPVNSKNTLFRIASISKCITGLAFGKMVEEGILKWDDSLRKHLPDYPKKEFDFTLRQLASHTAGIRGYRGKEYALNKPFSIEDGIEIFQNDPLVFEPGKGYLYNSFDFVLLSLAMQKASGIPFEHYVKEKVLLPLGMTNTYTPNELSEQTKTEVPVARFYTKWANHLKEASEVNNFYKLAGGGYLSSSSDIAKLGQAILEQNLLKPETYKELLSEQTINGNTTYYGLGFQVSQDAKGRHFVGHVGNSVGAYTNLFIYHDLQMVFVVLMNCTDPRVQNDLDAILDKISIKYLYS